MLSLPRGWEIVKSESVSHSVASDSLQLFVTPWTAAYQALLSIDFSRKEYWSGLPFLSPGIFPTQGWNPGLLHCRWILNRLATRPPSGQVIGNLKSLKSRGIAKKKKVSYCYC